MATNTLLFTNNAVSNLSAGITSTATSFTVTTGQGALFAAPGTNEAFLITLIDAATQLITEIMLCTARSGDTFTVVRGQEGTTAVSWLQGDIVRALFTAGTASAWIQVAGSQSAGTAVTVIASPMPYSPTVQGDIYIDGGVFTAITIDRAGTNWNCDISTRSLHLSANDTVTLTYTTAPTSVSFLPS